MKRKSGKRAGVDWLVRRVVESANEVVTRAARKVRETEEGRRTWCLLLIDGSDPIARGFYEHCLQVGMSGPPQIKHHMVTTFIQPYEGIMEVAGSHYALEGHLESPLDREELRAVVLTLGTLTVVRLGPDSKPRAASTAYRPLRPDVLLMALACWHNDRPEGFLVRAIFRSREQGETFIERYQQRRAEIEAARPTRGEIEEELLRFKPTWGRREVPLDVQARVYAQVGWLEDNGHLPGDRFSGLEFTYGCQMDLYAAGEMVRRHGGPSDVN